MKKSLFYLLGLIFFVSCSENDGIHRPERHRVPHDFIEVLHHVALVGNGDIKAVKIP